MSASRKKVTLHFIGGEEAHIDVNLGEWPDAFEKALNRNGVLQIGVLQIDEASGGRVGISPRSVLYWKSVPEGEPQ